MKNKIIIPAFSLLLMLPFINPPDTLAASIERGKGVYKTNCIACHMVDGQGLQGTFPPLAKTNRLANKSRLVKIVTKGLNEPITIKGETYEVEMPGVNLNDQDVMDVLNYVRNSWGNKGTRIVLGEVKKARALK